MITRALSARLKFQPLDRPAVLLREGWREGGKVRKRTLANLSKWPPALVEGLRVLLKGGTAVSGLGDAFDIVRSRPHGHVAAVLGTLRDLRLDRTIAGADSPERRRAVAMIVARILDPGSKLAAARGLAADAARDSLADTRRDKRRLKGEDRIGVRVGKVVGKYKMAKHFGLDIEADSFGHRRKPGSIAAEAALDGLYVVRTQPARRANSAPRAPCAPTSA